MSPPLRVAEAHGGRRHGLRFVLYPFSIVPPIAHYPRLSIAALDTLFTIFATLFVTLFVAFVTPASPDSALGACAWHHTRPPYSAAERFPHSFVSIFLSSVASFFFNSAAESTMVRATIEPDTPSTSHGGAEEEAGPADRSFCPVRRGGGDAQAR